MPTRHRASSDPRIARCLEEIAALRDARDLSPEEVSLRLAQYAACARGERCPEVEFHPVARALTEVAARLARRRRARDAWERRVSETIAARGAPDNDAPCAVTPSSREPASARPRTSQKPCGAAA